MTSHDPRTLRRERRPRRLGLGVLAGAAALAALVAGVTTHPADASTPLHATTAVTSGSGIHTIQHVVVIMQENRSFDSYYGTYPGADGIPRENGRPTTCNPSTVTGRCVAPYRDDAPGKTVGGPHDLEAATADIDGGAMDGYVEQAETRDRTHGYRVMGYHTARSIPNYWAYARHYVLHDHMFASQRSWSLPEHLFMVSGWSATCPPGGDPMACTTGAADPPHRNIADNVVLACGERALTDACRDALHEAGARRVTAVHDVLARPCDVSRSYDTATDSYDGRAFTRCTAAIRDAHLRPRLETRLLTAADELRPPDYSWTDLTWLLHRYGVSWRYYVMNGTEPDCRDDSEATCPKHSQNRRTPGIWNPLPYFDTVQQNHQLGNIQGLAAFYQDARQGTLPAVSWVTPSAQVSEHPPNTVEDGQAYVTGLVNSIMRGPDWDSTAIFISWDDWGGFYDHVPPPSTTVGQWGLRVPSLLISPYARRGYVDHQPLSHDAYLKFIEDDFLGGARIDPATDGRPDQRPSVREDDPALGDLADDFDFTQEPQPPLILPGETIW